MEPVGGVGDDGRSGRQAELKGLKHAPKIGGHGEITKMDNNGPGLRHHRPPPLKEEDGDKSKAGKR
jgi:hypothetical protein